ncbi:AcrB/AcrD/AcrF family protein [Sphingomonas sabuli]|uniref:AcrB/AcrD/AcrF family protein n=1 Tax=Sphingomonas sabuli TaxID=2764186 RepID=A0A7G9KZI8_9SPHN|nr:AcrB/AcrD/AcrF family protein [Sphingomonas sabuli]QNM81787.1 AcrB/AcrD/AcrF family protein [Sphingomonas sabuli]
MSERKDDIVIGRVLAFLERHWMVLVLAAWMLFAAWFLAKGWSTALAFGLGDTDDNMRMSQARALLAGQGWFDLRQYRLNPPFGADIHWSRLVDLPLAAIILLTRPFIGGADAERTAAAIAPILPYLVLLFGIALTARRLVDPRAFLLPLIAMVVAGLANSMFMPDRVDHHGWQLALLSISIAGLADPKRVRGGLTLGVTTALSFAIGLEMIIYLAIAGAAVALFWVVDAGERRRAIAYAASLGGGVAFSFLVFASDANRQAVCDALSPVWLSDLLLASALLLVLAWLSPADWKKRLALGAGAAVVLAAFHALAWPHCLTRLEGVSPEVYDLWLSKVREARPIYRHGWQTASVILALPVTGLIGWTLLAWRNRIDADLFRRTIAAALPAITAFGLLFWQTRTGPAAQVLAVTGAVAIVWVLAPIFDRSSQPLIRTLGVAAVALIGFGAVVPLALQMAPAKTTTKREVQINRANRLCNFIGSYRDVGRQPKGVVFTFVDLAPRLITVTHHDSIIGPYHRNGQQIVDVMRAFRGTPDEARAIFAKYKADYLLTCPDSSTTTIFRSEAPKGFYAQLSKGEAPGWLTPVPLADKSPFRMWRIAR